MGNIREKVIEGLTGLLILILISNALSEALGEFIRQARKEAGPLMSILFLAILLIFFVGGAITVVRYLVDWFKGILESF